MSEINSDPFTLAWHSTHSITEPPLSLTKVMRTKAEQASTSEVLYFLGKYPLFLMAITGAITNALNIVVFWTQGLKDSVRISLTTLAFWDLIKCATGIGINVRPYIEISSAAYSLWYAIVVSKVSYLQVMANYVSYPLAAYISIERAFCVTLPFKVKFIFTPRFTSAVVLFISVSVCGMFVPLLFVYDIGYRTDPLTNQSVAFFYFNEFHKEHGEEVFTFFKIMAIVNPVFSLIIMSVSTTVISYQLKLASSFRAQSHNDAKPKMTLRDKQVVKMLLVLIAVFILNLLPRVAHQMAKLIEPEYHLLRSGYHIFSISTTVVFFCDFFNSSSSLFIYLAMSSQYVATLRYLFCCSTEKTKDSLRKLTNT